MPEKGRDSNLELFRIIVMLLIIAHHYVVNSDLMLDDGPIKSNPESLKTFWLYLFGMWGKTGINCFLMITGYFMCLSRISLRKFFKILLEVYFYRVLIYIVFLLCGRETISAERLLQVVFPFWGINDNFTGCFIVFYLMIPFLTLFVQNIDRRQHTLLLILLLSCYTLMGSIPKFRITFNYVTWFSIIFLISSYIRLHPLAFFEKKRLWRNVTIISSVLAAVSVVVLGKFFQGAEYYLVADSNKFFAVLISVSSFLWFKNIRFPQNKTINLIGGSTFGVLLVHANSDAMRHWLWGEVVDCVGHFEQPLIYFVIFTIVSVLAVFISCILIDRGRIIFFERPFFNWYDKKERFVLLRKKIGIE